MTTLIMFICCITATGNDNTGGNAPLIVSVTACGGNAAGGGATGGGATGGRPTSIKYIKLYRVYKNCEG